ncbi:MAG: hypothetical protein ABJA87_07425 [bacterium]
MSDLPNLTAHFSSPARADVARTVPSVDGANPGLDRRLQSLNASFVYRVNAAVGDGRDDVAQALSEDYIDEAHELLADAPPPAPR